MNVHAHKHIYALSLALSLILSLLLCVSLLSFDGGEMLNNSMCVYVCMQIQTDIYIHIEVYIIWKSRYLNMKYIYTHTHTHTHTHTVLLDSDKIICKDFTTYMYIRTCECHTYGFTYML